MNEGVEDIVVDTIGPCHITQCLHFCRTSVPTGLVASRGEGFGTYYSVSVDMGNGSCRLG